LHLRALLEQAGVTGGGIRSAVEHFAIEYPSSGRAADTGYTLNRWTGPAPVRLASNRLVRCCVAGRESRCGKCSWLFAWATLSRCPAPRTRSVI